MFKHSRYALQIRSYIDYATIRIPTAETAAQNCAVYAIVPGRVRSEITFAGLLFVASIFAIIFVVPSDLSDTK